MVRLHHADSLFDTLARIAAATISGCELIISIPSDLTNRVTAFLHGKKAPPLVKNFLILYQSDSEVISMMDKIQRIRNAAPGRVPRPVLEAAAERGFYIGRSKVMMEGRIELLQYSRQQSICYNYHRYGNLGERGLR
ncbi:hypothetical protein ACFL9U_11090 [Thermodesulfobacteriota bacterium]